MRHRLPRTTAALERGRSVAEGWLAAAYGEPLHDDARLALTELLANAIRHGGLEEGDEIGLHIDDHGGAVRIEVEQPTSAEGARVVEPSERGASGGFGLAIVDGVAERWGVEAGPPGCVWFEMPLRGNDRDRHRLA